jgi:uncharacterized protein
MENRLGLVGGLQAQHLCKEQQVCRERELIRAHDALAASKVALAHSEAAAIEAAKHGWEAEERGAAAVTGKQTAVQELLKSQAQLANVRCMPTGPVICLLAAATQAMAPTMFATHGLDCSGMF